MKFLGILLALGTLISAAFANTAPTPVIVSATMRANTTYMDVVYKVIDPDDATVKVRALAFVNGVRSFSSVLRPATFVEGTEANLGDAISTNTNHTLTWDVGADWNIDLGQVKFEILALDGRRLLASDWISIPAAGGQPAVAISKDEPSTQSVFSGLLWLYATGDAGLALSSGTLSGSQSNGVFSGVPLASGTTVQTYGPAFLFKRMNLAPASCSEVSYAATTARAGLLNTSSWHALNQTYEGLPIVLGWGIANSPPPGLTGTSELTAIVTPLSASLGLGLKKDGTVVGWGAATNGVTSIPAGLTGVKAIAGSYLHGLALKNDGTVVTWSPYAPAVPAGLTGVTAIAAGEHYSIALKSDGTVVGWGSVSVPSGLSGVTAIASGYSHCLALKSNGTVVGWGGTGSSIPGGLSGVTAISAGYGFSLALKNDGTVVGWGTNNYGQVTIPSGLTGVTAISAGDYHSLALKNDGTVVAWGRNDSGQSTVPTGISGVTAISASGWASFVLKSKGL